MITIEIKDGLGNQLFQYAAGRALSIHLHTSLVIDKSYYKYNKSRNYELDYFEIKGDYLKSEEPFKLKPEIYLEPAFKFDNSFFNNQDNTILSGYWQSEKYFKHIAAVLRKEFIIKSRYVEHLALKANELKKCNSIAMHIRRGDYLYSQHFNFFGVQPIDYYRKAINYFERILKDFKLFIFSDDINWVKQNLVIKNDHEFISGSVTQNHIEDFFLMQNCSYHIIANSTFSWWAAWLSNYSDKKVIAPNNWFKGLEHDTNYLYPESWIKV